MSILVLFPLRAQFPWYDVCSEAQTHLGLWVCTFCRVMNSPENMKGYWPKTTSIITGTNLPRLFA
jgi:hypothetical protein